MSNSYIKWLDQVRRADREMVGGKAANLGELISNHIRSPMGFCITILAFDQFMMYSRADTYIKQATILAHSDARTQRISNIETARSLIVKTDIPDDMVFTIAEAIALLLRNKQDDKSWLIVRSSAIVEDSQTGSFAGQFDSVVGVRGVQAVLNSVKNCWSSTLNQRAISYAGKTGHNIFGTKMGVIVQEMVIPEKSGVLFTTHPVSGDQEQMVIEAVWGLGESLVSGSVRPDTFTVDKTSMQVLEKRIVKKATGRFINFEAGEGSVACQIPNQKQNIACLEQEEINELVTTGKRIEAIYKYPQDIEWAIDDNKQVHILQTRSVTFPAKSRTEIPTQIV